MCVQAPLSTPKQHLSYGGLISTLSAPKSSSLSISCDVLTLPLCSRLQTNLEVPRVCEIKVKQSQLMPHPLSAGPPWSAHFHSDVRLSDASATSLTEPLGLGTWREIRRNRKRRTTRRGWGEQYVGKGEDKDVLGNYQLHP